MTDDEEKEKGAAFRFEEKNVERKRKKQSPTVWSIAVRCTFFRSA